MLLLLVDGLDDVVVGADVVVNCSVIGCFLDLDKRILLELLFGDRGEVVDVVGLQAEMQEAQSKEQDV